MITVTQVNACNFNASLPMTLGKTPVMALQEKRAAPTAQFSPECRVQL